MIKSWMVILLVAGFLLAVGGCSKNKEEASNKETPELAKKETPATSYTDTQQVAIKSVPGEPKQETQLETKKETKKEPKKENVPPPEPKEVELTVPGSTQLSVTISDTIQTNKNHTGDRFNGTLASPVEVEGNTVFPAGSKVNLVVTKLVKGGTLKTPPEIAFTVESITTPDGKNYNVSANEYYEKGKSHTNKEVGMIGGGAAAGAIIGGLAGKKKGAVVGAVAGAAAGTGVAAATGRQNLVFAPGQSVTFTTTQQMIVTLPRK
jgi:outer membrane lipoprotein SlyB